MNPSLRTAPLCLLRSLSLHTQSLTKKKVLVLSMLLTYFLHPTNAQQAGELDPSFGTNGVSMIQFKEGNLGNESGSKLFVQSDGRMIAIAKLEGALVLCRYNADGSVDETYGTNGHSVPSYIDYSCAAMQPDGKVVIGWNVVQHFAIASDYHSYLIRYNMDGSLDTDFGTVYIDEPIDFQPTSMAIQPDGKILVGGYKVFQEDFTDEFQISTVVRRNINGTIDQSFGTNGYVYISTNPFFVDIEYTSSIALQSDGKILVTAESLGGGNSSYLIRCTSSGDLDLSFNEDGIVDLDFVARSVTTQSDKKIVLAGSLYNGIAYNLVIGRYNSNGSPDPSFGEDGKVTTFTGISVNGAFTVAVQSNGKIVASGTPSIWSPSGLIIVRYNSTGSPDYTFDRDGELVPDFKAGNSFTLLPHDKIAITGYVHNGTNNDIVLARYNGNGTPDPTLDGDGKAIVFYEVGYSSFISTAIQQDGKLVALAQSYNGKYYDKLLTRYTSQGALDESFNGDGMLAVDFAVHAVTIQPGGKIIVAGGIHFNSIQYPVIACYNPDGSRDLTFGIGGKSLHLYSSIVAMAIQKDGKIVVVGNTSTFGEYDFAITRYNSNGTLDLSFNRFGYVTTDLGSPEDFVKSVAIQEDGKIVVSGITQENQTFGTAIALARYNSNGSLDQTFDDDGKAYTEIFNPEMFLSLREEIDAKGSLAVQPDGKILVAAELWLLVRNLDPALYSGVTRLNSDGSFDDFFGEFGSAGITEGSNPKLLIDHQSSGKFILSTSSTVQRYQNDGTVDNSFIGSNKGISEIKDIAIGNKRLYTVGSINIFPQAYAGISASFLEDNGSPIVKQTIPANATALSYLQSKQDNLKGMESLSTARLEQNFPNPARGNTVIRYHIPVNSSIAQLLVTDQNGQMVQKQVLNNKASGQISINTASLPAGIYTYTLYVNGTIVNSRKLIIAR